MPELSAAEVRRRVPTLVLIEDDRTRAVTNRLTRSAPDYFWERPASTSSYHHPECRAKRGLWAHTLLLSSAIEELAPSYERLGLLGDGDRDLAHAAAILHDQRKYGDPERPRSTSTPDHDVEMAAVVRESPLDERVARAVESHNGPWYDGTEPETFLDLLVHTADMIASTGAITPAIQEPVPEELDSLELPSVDLR